jgi:hypothetical protein
MSYSIRTNDGIVIDNIPDDVEPDSDVLKNRVNEIRASRAAEQPQKVQAETESPSFGRIAGGLGAEVGIATSGQAAGAALAPFTAGISYPVLAFSSGVAGSIAAQKVEGRGDISNGRALFAGMINLIPGSNLAKVPLKTAMVSGATRGAAIGAGEVTAMSVVDEGRAPTMGELAEYAGGGAAFGGVLNSLFKGGSRLWGKIKKKTPEQIDGAIASGEITPQELLPAGNTPDNNVAGHIIAKSAEDSVMAAQEASALAIAVESPSTALSRFTDRLKQVKAAVAPSRVVGKEIQSVAIQARQEAGAAEELGSIIAKDLDIFIKKQADPLDATQKINAYIDGKISELPKSYAPVQNQLDLFREKRLDLQAKLIANIDSGRTPATPEMREIVGRSMDEGNYLTREFKFFTDENYFPTQKQLDAVRAEIGEGADEVLADLNKKKLSLVKNRNFLPTAIDGFLRQRKELGPAVLDYLGEIKEPGERIRGTLSRVARGVYRDEADGAIKSILEGNGLATRTPGPRMQELQLKRFEKEGSGLYVEPHIQQALNQIYTVDNRNAAKLPVISGLSDLWNTGIGLSKAVKVLLNPPSYSVQVYGNSFNLLGMGVNPFGGAGRGLRLALSEYGPINRLTKNPAAREALLRDINEMSRYGIKGTNILDSDIRSNLERGIFSDTAQKAIDPVSKAYTTPDTVGRFVAWKHHQQMNRDVFPSANEEAIKQFSADVTNDVYQNYARLSSTGRELTRIGILPQFASFTMEFARNQYNQGRIIKEMMAGRYGANVPGLGAPNLDAMRRAAGERLSALLGVYAMTYAGIKAWNVSNGVDNKMDAALKETALPEWDEERLLAISFDPETKTGKYANPSYVVPHAVGLSAFDKGLKGEPISGVADLLIDEFVGEGSFIFLSVAQAISNTNFRNRKKITAEVDRYNRVKDLVSFAIKDSFEPGFVREVRKLQQARRGQGDLTQADVVRRQLGARINSFNAEESARFRIKENVDNINLVSSGYRSARKYRNLSGEQIAQEYQNANTTQRANMEKIIRHQQNLLTMGFDENQSIQILKDAGLGAARILDVLSKRISDLPVVDRVTPTSVWEERISILPKNEQEREISRIAQTEPELGRSLYNMMRSDRRAEALGITGIDRLYMSLGALDGTRAEYIYKAMLDSPDPQGFLGALRRKGIVTPKVEQDIQRHLALSGQSR